MVLRKMVNSILAKSVNKTKCTSTKNYFPLSLTIIAMEEHEVFMFGINKRKRWRVIMDIDDVNNRDYE